MRHLRLFEYIDAIVRSGSIRRAAEQLHITASALDRRVQQLEEELEAPLFERHARGMRLTAAGEIFLNYIRRHLADLEQVRSEINGLKGLRLGHVDVVASQALALKFLPEQMNQFRHSFPGVSFSVRIVDHHAALRALMAFEADLAVVVFPKLNSEILPLIMVAQPIMAMMDAQHPLALKPELRLSDCLSYPLILPDASLGSRELLDPILARRAAKVQVRAETNSFELMRGLLIDGRSIGFQIGIGAPEVTDPGPLISRPISAKDVPYAPLVCAQLRTRTLSVAAARFADQISGALHDLDPDALHHGAHSDHQL